MRSIPASTAMAALCRRQIHAAGAARSSPTGHPRRSATLTYNTLDNNKNPTDDTLPVDFKQDFAGVGGNVNI